MTTPTLQHDVLPYSGPGGFVHTAVPIVRDALAVDAVPVVLATATEISAVRKAIGRQAATIVGLDMAVAGRNPARLLPALQYHVEKNPTREIVCVAEPVRAEHDDALIGEVERHELAMRLPPFASWKCRMSCAYDSSTLSPDVVATLEACHVAASADAMAEVERRRAEPLPPRPHLSAELGVDRTTLSALRGFIQGRAQSAGLGSERVHDLVYAVNEVVTNSICHGEGRARVSLWTEGSTVVCEVRDRGWIRDPLAGRLVPDPDRRTGRGLWLVNQLCDLVQLRSSSAGTTLRLHVDTPGADSV